MTSIPPLSARVPTALTSQLLLGSITQSNRELLDLQVQLATGRRISKPSDDPGATSAATVLDASLERRGQRLRNLDHATNTLGAADAALGELSNLLLEARTIASSQIGAASDPATRANQAQIVDSLLAQAIEVANRTYGDLALFGGSAVGRAPMVSAGGGVEYRGLGDGMRTDLGLTRSVPITLAGPTAFGSETALIESRAFTPALDGATRLLDLRGATGDGVRPGHLVVEVNGNAALVEISGAHTVQDVVDQLQNELDVLDPGATVSIDPTQPDRLRIIPGAAGTITIRDVDAPATAADLGLDRTFTAGAPAGASLQPRIVPGTRLDQLPGVSLGPIELSNGTETRTLDLAGIATVQDLVNEVAALDLGIRVSISEDGSRLRFSNARSGAAMSIGESGKTTAGDLGLRTFDLDTPLARFNDGRGVNIVTGAVDPVTGDPDPARNVDFRITLKDGTEFDVDLEGAATVGDVLDAINAAAVDAGAGIGIFQATLAANGNGFALTDGSLAFGTTTVAAMNGSFAASDLGLLGSSDSAILAGEDRATIAVDGVFAHLIALRDALLSDDERGITLAGQGLDADIERATGARAEVGVRARTVDQAVIREEALQLQETSLRSELVDLDFTEAALRVSLVQQQLQAGLTTAGLISNLSLLDFLR